MKKVTNENIVKLKSNYHKINEQREVVVVMMMRIKETRNGGDREN